MKKINYGHGLETVIEVKDDDGNERFVEENQQDL